VVIIRDMTDIFWEFLNEIAFSQKLEMILVFVHGETPLWCSECV
jgi:hypothetical protein